MLRRSLFYCLFALSGLAHAASAQGQVLFEPKDMFPAQGGPGVKTLFLPQGTALMMGGVGTLLVGNNTGLGAGGYSLADQFVIETQGQKRDLGLSYGGLILDYSIVPRQLFYLNFSAMGGIGQAYVIPRVTGSERIISNFVFVEPDFNIMLNVTRELRVAFGMGLFITGGADIAGSIGSGVSGANAQVVLFYGKL
jgi:hypothetical protein